MHLHEGCTIIIVCIYMKVVPLERIGNYMKAVPNNTGVCFTLTPMKRGFFMTDNLIQGIGQTTSK